VNLALVVVVIINSS